MSKLQCFCNTTLINPLEENSNLELSQYSGSDFEREKNMISELPSRTYCTAGSSAYCNCESMDDLSKPIMCKMLMTLKDFLLDELPKIREHMENLNASIKSITDQFWDECEIKTELNERTFLGKLMRLNRQKGGGDDSLKRGGGTPFFKTSPQHQLKEFHMKMESDPNSPTNMIGGYQKHVERMQRGYFNRRRNDASC